jgi:hypothetical protein
MRLMLLAVVVAACGSRPPPAPPPANQAPAPDYRATTGDQLGFLPADAEIVVGVDIAAIRRSSLWHAFEPQFDALMRQFPEVSACSQDYSKNLARITVSVKMLAPKRFDAVMVVHGTDMARGLACSIADAKRKGGTATVDRGVTITTSPSSPEHAGAMMLVGPRTLVVHIAPGASYDTLTKVLASGAPLRQSPAFMELYRRRERGAAMWGMANGNAAFFSQLGMRPRSIDGTIIVTDDLMMAVRVTMQSPQDAASLEAQIDQIKPMAGGHVRRLDTRLDGAKLQIDVAMTEVQIRQLLDKLGGAMGP